MPRETRIQGVVDHAEAMIELLEQLRAEAQTRAEALQQKAPREEETIAFLQDFAERAAVLAEVVEDEIIGGAIGLNNLAGPIYHLLGEDD